MAPGLLDRYLGRTGFDSQQTDEPEDRDRQANLYDPVPGDQAARGRFDDRAAVRSPQLWATTHRRSLALGVAAAAVLSLARRLRR
jgi:hypothetical protein